MLVSGRFEYCNSQLSSPLPLPLSLPPYQGGFEDVHAHNFSWKRYVHVHEKYPRNVLYVFFFFAIRKRRYRKFRDSSGIRSESNRFGIIERGRGVRFNCCGVVGCTLLLRTCTHTVTRTRHTQLVQEWPLIGWKNARSRVCRRRVCEVMVSTSFYGLARARTVYLCAQHPPQPRSPLCAPCKTHTTPRACYFASAPTDSLDRSWKQQITTRVQLDKRNRFSIPDIPEERSRDFVL